MILTFSKSFQSVCFKNKVQVVHMVVSNMKNEFYNYIIFMGENPTKPPIYIWSEQERKEFV